MASLRGRGRPDRYPPLISVIRTVVWACRCPWVRRYFFRRLNLNTMIFRARPCLMTSPATEAPATVGVPTVTRSPSATRRTRSKRTGVPGPPPRPPSLPAPPASPPHALPGADPVLLPARLQHRVPRLILRVAPGAGHPAGRPNPTRGGRGLHAAKAYPYSRARRPVSRTGGLGLVEEAPRAHPAGRADAGDPVPPHLHP